MTINNKQSNTNNIIYNLSQVPIILIPVCSTNLTGATTTILTTTGDIDNQQRSFGCQTNMLLTQETGSQTKTYDINQQETQTNATTYASTFTSTTAQMSTDIHDEYLQDAATSTSPPLIEDIESFLNDISTQTICSYNQQQQQPATANLDQFRSISIQTHEVNLNPDYFTIDVCDGQKSEQSSNFDMNRSCGNQTYMSMCNAPSQTEDYYFNSMMGGTSSIQTQTISSSSRNGAQTQTELDFS